MPLRPRPANRPTRVAALSLSFPLLVAKNKQTNSDSNPSSELVLVFGGFVVFFLLKSNLTLPCCAWEPAEGDKPLSFIAACSLLSLRFQGLSPPTALLLFGLKYCFYEK